MISEIDACDPRHIHLLPPSVANQIAAGEVVERPASVVKEILENAIDAGASKIHIELLNSGLSLIRITDNGVGIPKVYLPLSLSRHATSKIKSTLDLENIRSLGFRGEALASIASVSKLTITSKTSEATQAYQCRVQGDYLEPEVLSATHTNGTSVEVRDLFYNVPVRRKFLKSIKTEFERIDEIFKKIALSHYNIHFTLTHNQKKLRDYPKALSPGAQVARVQKICGSSFMESGYQIDFEKNKLRLSGYLGGLKSASRHAGCQYFFVNQRSIRDKVISHAIKTAFHSMGIDLEGLYPAYVLYLELDPKEVDVNVHPTKHEVRFLHSRIIHDFISQSILAVLEQEKLEAPEIKVPLPLEYQSQSLVAESLPLGFLKTTHYPKKLPPPNNGLAFSNYYFLSANDHLIIIDMKKATLEGHATPLLFPVKLYDMIFSIEDRQVLKNAGFEFAQNIKQEWMLTHMPKQHACMVKFNQTEIASLFK